MTGLTTLSQTRGPVGESRHTRYKCPDRHRRRPIPGDLAISIVSIAELQFGVLVATDEARAVRLSRLSAIQRRFDPPPVDEAVADSYAQLAARVTQIGRQSRVMDLFIAATAHAHNATIYTRNPGDLAGARRPDHHRISLTVTGTALPAGVRDFVEAYEPDKGVGA